MQTWSPAPLTVISALITYGVQLHCPRGTYPTICDASAMEMLKDEFFTTFAKEKKWD
jgi:hypothetical protein